MDELVTLEPWAQWLILVPLSGLLLYSAWTDWKVRKVYNKVTYPAMVVGLALHLIVQGLPGLGDGAIGFVLAFVIGLVMMPFGWIGGGDVKLLMAVGAALGVQALGEITFYSVWIGAILGLVMAIANGYLIEMLKKMGRYIRGWYRLIIYKQAVLKESLEKDERNKVPYAIAILGGAILTYTDAVYQWPQFWDWYTTGIGF
ncbi:MAG: A24 family peptidase [bacterium]